MFLRIKYFTNESKLNLFEIKPVFTLPNPDPERREEALKASIKTFEAPQRSVKIKILVYLYLNTTF